MHTPAVTLLILCAAVVACGPSERERRAAMERATQDSLRDPGTSVIQFAANGDTLFHCERAERITRSDGGEIRLHCNGREVWLTGTVQVIPNSLRP